MEIKRNDVKHTNKDGEPISIGVCMTQDVSENTVDQGEDASQQEVQSISMAIKDEKSKQEQSPE